MYILFTRRMYTVVVVYKSVVSSTSRRMYMIVVVYNSVLRSTSLFFETMVL
jgi:hypothetical protein